MGFISCPDHQHALCLRVLIETDAPVLIFLYIFIQLVEDENDGSAWWEQFVSLCGEFTIWRRLLPSF
jgi:hypothetical protein